MDDSVVTCDEIINAANSVSTNVSANVTCTVPIIAENSAPINFDDKKVEYKMNCCILHTTLLGNILLFMMVIISYHYPKHKSKQKNIGALTE